MACVDCDQTSVPTRKCFWCANDVCEECQEFIPNYGIVCNICWTEYEEERALAFAEDQRKDEF